MRGLKGKARAKSRLPRWQAHACFHDVFAHCRQAAYRGVRAVSVRLDDLTVFEGEVRRAPGRVLQQNQLPLSSASLEPEGFDVGGDAAPRNIIEEVAETILFTLDTGILSAIAEHDPHVHLTRVGGAVDYIAAACIEAAAEFAEERRPATVEIVTSRPRKLPGDSKPAKWAAVALQQQAEGIELPSRRPQRSGSAIRRRNRRRELAGDAPALLPRDASPEGGSPARNVTERAATRTASAPHSSPTAVPAEPSAAGSDQPVSAGSSEPRSAQPAQPVPVLDANSPRGDVDDMDALEAELRDLFKADAAAAALLSSSIICPASNAVPVAASTSPVAVPGSPGDANSDEDWEAEVRRMIDEPSPPRNGATGALAIAPASAHKPAAVTLPELDDAEEDLLNDLMASRNAVMLRPLVAELQQRDSVEAADALPTSPPRGAAGLSVAARESMAAATASLVAHGRDAWVTGARAGQLVSLAALPHARDITLCILSTHGDPHYAGLTGLRVWVARPVAGQSGVGCVVEHTLTPRDLRAAPQDINVDGHSGDVRTLDKLVDGVNVTTDDVHMWLIPFLSAGSGGIASSRGDHVLRIRLPAPTWIAGLTVYNYNKSAEDSFRGVKHVSVGLGRHWVRHGPSTCAALGVADGDGARGGDVIPLRRAPGYSGVDFGQHLDFELVRAAERSGAGGGQSAPDIRLVQPCYPALSRRGQLIRTPVVPSTGAASGAPLAPRQDFEVPRLPPIGHSVRLSFSGTWGDPFYLGIDAVALYDAEGKRIPVFPWQISATPFGLGDAGGGGAGPADARNAANVAYLPSGIEAAAAADGPSVAVPAGDECAQRLDDPVLYVPASAPATSSTSTPVPFPPRRAWLTALPAPHPDTGLRPSAVLTFTFDAPVAIALIRVFNYSKTPARGAAEVEVAVDGLVVFQGELADAPPSGLHSAATLRQAAKAGGGGAGATVPRPCNSIVLSDDRALLAAEHAAGRLHFCGAAEQQVLCFNNGRMAVGVSSAKAVKVAQALEQSLRPSATGGGGAGARLAKGAPQRPRTAVHVQ